MKIAVVGSKGFIGRRLVGALRDQEHEVVELDLPRMDIEKLIPDDPEFCEVLKGTEAIYHLAVMNLEHCKRDPHGCIRTNVIGTLNVMELAKKVGVKRVVYSSASSVYGQSSQQPVPEYALTNPLTLYGVTKLAGEKVVQLYQNGADLTTAIFRFSNVYGPGQVNGIIPAVINSILSDQGIKITGTGDQTRDFVFVDDVVSILVRAAKHPLYSFTSNLGSGEAVSINRVVSVCSQELGKAPRVQYVPLESDRNAYCADLQWFRRVFGDYKFTAFDEGISRTIKWYLEEHGHV